MKRLICIFAVAMLFFTAGCGSEAVNQETETDRAKIQFTDDSGFVIEMDEPAQRIISLYSAHTENLFSLGLEQEIIGVYKTDNYPSQVAKKTVYDYRSDPEKVIAAEPDLVLIRPFIERSKPEFVEALRKAKINVVSLYPESFDGFTQYIEKLGLLTGKEEKAQELLAQFENEILSIQTITAKVDKQVGVYFESTENNYRTVTSDAMPALAIKFAGGRNVASDAEGLQEGSSIAAYGAERILEKAVEIDVYVAQVGGMNSGVTAEGIKERPGFHAIKAAQEGRVYTISEKLISSPTFRFSKGVKELARMFYPEIMDSLDAFAGQENLNRAQMAEAAVMFNHQEVYVPSSRNYAKSPDGHVYGDYVDVRFDHPGFDYIETAVLAGYINGYGQEFRPDEKVTGELAVQVLCKSAGLDVWQAPEGSLQADEFITGNELIDLAERIR